MAKTEDTKNTNNRGGYEGACPRDEPYKEKSGHGQQKVKKKVKGNAVGRISPDAH